MHHSNAAVCGCGRTKIELSGDPIESATCYCRSCRTGAPRDLNAFGGVDYCLYRKDRVRIAEGAGHLQEHRLNPDSPTRRIVANCCGSAMFADFTPGHWLSVFRRRLSGPALEPRLCVMTKYKAEGARLPDGVPAYETMPPRLMLKLLAAWAAMGFRRPKITW